MFKLRTEILTMLLQNKGLQGALMDDLNISWNTLYRWMRTNDPQLTMYHALQIIAEHTGTDISNQVTYYPKNV